LAATYTGATIVFFFGQDARMHSSPFSSGWKQLMPAHPKPFSGGSLSAPFQNRFGAIAFISLRRKQQRQGWQPLGWLQQEAMYPAPFFLEAESNLCSSTPLFPEGRPLFYEAGSNLYRRIFSYAKQAARLHSSLCFSGWKQFMPAPSPPSPQRRPSVKPRPV